MWEETVSKVLPLMRDQSTVFYLDFVKDVEDVTDVVKRGDVNVSKYTGKMNVDARKETEKNFLLGKFSVLVATEVYKLGVGNPNISQVIRIGCSRNIGVLLQELGSVGRKPNSTAVALLQQKKLEVIESYVIAWKFIYSIYHGKYLSRSLAVLCGGAGDNDPPMCFIFNSPLCTVCLQVDDICQWSVDMQSFLLTLLNTMQQIHNAGLPKVSKTLLISILLHSNEVCVRSLDALGNLLDSDDGTCWG